MKYRSRVSMEQETGGPEVSKVVDHTAEIEALRAERDALKAQLATVHAKVDGRKRRDRFRKTIALLLVILACLSFTVAISAGWTRRTLFNTNQWVETVTPIVDHPSVTAALSRRMTSEVLTLVNAQSVAEEALPPRAKLLVGPMTQAVGDFIEDEVNTLLQSDAFKQLWVRANRFAQPQVVAALRGEGEVLSSEDGKVVLNLVPVVNQVLKRVQARAGDLFGRNVNLPEISSGEVPELARQKLQTALGVPVPPDLGEIVVFQSDKLEAAQDAVVSFDRALVLIAALTIVAIFAALKVSRNRRRTLIQMSAGILVGLVIMRRLVMYLQDEVVGIARSENRGAARAIVEDLMRGFFSLTEVVIAAGLLIIALALLTGPYAWAMATRRRVAAIVSALTQSAGRLPRDQGVASWVRVHRDALQLGGVIVGVLLLLVVDLSWGPFLVAVGLVLLYQLVVFRVGKDPAAEPSG
jgi:hypothetical protein